MAVQFDRANSEYCSGTTPVTAVPLTMACWGYIFDTTNVHSILQITKSSATTDAFRLGADGSSGSNPIQFASRASGSQETAITTTGYSSNTWHHFCGVSASATSRAAYIDGGSKGTNSVSRVPAGLDTIGIGAFVGSSIVNPIDGHLAEVAIWDVALSDEDVAILATGVPAWMVKPGDLVAYWPLVSAGHTQIDLVGSADCTETGTLSTVEHPSVISQFLPQPMIITASAGAPAGTWPHGPLGHPLHGAFGGPI